MDSKNPSGKTPGNSGAALYDKIASMDFIDRFLALPGGAAPLSAISTKTFVGRAAGGDRAKAGPAAAPDVGVDMPDGTIFAGISPDTGRPMYAALCDAPTTLSFNDAAAYAKNLKAHGHADWRVPTPGELAVLFANRAKICGLNKKGSIPHGWYWSSGAYNAFDGWGQRFNNGYTLHYAKSDRSSVRCVR